MLAPPLALNAATALALVADSSFSTPELSARARAGMEPRALGSALGVFRDHLNALSAGIDKLNLLHFKQQINYIKLLLNYNNGA
jgi:hypothetical protein